MNTGAHVSSGAAALDALHGSAIASATAQTVAVPGIGPTTRFIRDWRHERILAPLARLMARYYRVRVFGDARIPHDRPVIYVGKHPRTFWYAETVLLGLVTFWDSGRPPFRVLEQTGTSLHRAPLLGWVRRHVGAIPAKEAHALDALRHGESLLIFPGGVRELYGPADALRWNGRTGFARLAAVAQVPIVPFAIIGADQQHPIRLRLGRSHHASIWLPPVPLPVSLDFHFGAPVPPPSSASPDDIAVHAKHVLDATRALVAAGLAARRRRWPARRRVC